MKLIPYLSAVVFSLSILACHKNSNPASGEFDSNTPEKTEIFQQAQTDIQNNQGGVDSGGGKGVRCGKKVTTLDLFEARSRGLIPLEKTDTLEGHLRFFGLELVKHFSESGKEFKDPQFSQVIYQELKTSILDRFQDIPRNTRLPMTADANLKIQIPEGCQLVQIAVMVKSGTIYRDTQYWSEMDPLEQSALVQHEFIYKRARQYQALYSDESRAVVGMIFSGNNPDPMFSPLWSTSKKIWCGAGRQNTSEEIFEFYGIDETHIDSSGNRNSGVRILYRGMKNIYMTSKTSVFFPGLTIEKILTGDFSTMGSIAKNSILNKKWLVEIAPDSSYPGSILTRAFEENRLVTPMSKGFCKLLK